MRQTRGYNVSFKCLPTRLRWGLLLLMVATPFLGSSHGFRVGGWWAFKSPSRLPGLGMLPRYTYTTSMTLLGGPSPFFEIPPSSVPMDTPARQSLPEHLRLEEMPGKGLGVIARTHIPSGSVVGDYKGELLTEDEKDRRYLSSRRADRLPEDLKWEQSRLDRGQTITGSYLYGVVVPSGGHIFVDAEDEYESLWTRFLNHASPPDNNVNPKSIHESWDGKPRVWFVATRDIEPGEEICFDYGDDYWLPDDNVV